VWGWLDVARSPIEHRRDSLKGTHQPDVDEITVSRSHAGRAHELLAQIYRDARYQIIPAAGSGSTLGLFVGHVDSHRSFAGYKTVQVLEQFADYYLHLTPIKKWDVCAPDALLRSHHGHLTTLANRSISYDHQTDDMLITDGLLATYKRKHHDVLKRLRSVNLTAFVAGVSNKRH
jgi:Golgi-resident PAP phosphatase